MAEAGVKSCENCLFYKHEPCNGSEDNKTCVRYLHNTVTSVVVCRECLYWTGMHGSNVMGECEHPIGGMRGTTDHKDFCSDGIRCSFDEKLDYQLKTENGENNNG